MAVKKQQAKSGLQRMGQWLAQRPMLSVVLALALILVFYLRGVLPLQRHVNDLEDQTVRQYETARTSAKLLDQFKAELAREQAVTDRLENLAGQAWRLDPKPAARQLERLMQKALSQAGLTPGRGSILDPLKKGRLLVVRVRMPAEGDIGRIKKFLEASRRRKDFVYISSYKVSPHKTRENILVMDLICAALVQPVKKG
jgi:hypothetical protein